MNNKIFWILYAVIFLGMIFYFWFYLLRGRPVQIHLDKWINGHRYRWKNLTGFMKLRSSDYTDEQLLIPIRPKMWLNIPDSKFFSTDMKGRLWLHGVVDQNNTIYWVAQDDTIFVDSVKEIEEPELDQNNKPVYEDVYVKNENGELELEMVFNDKKQPILDENGQPIMQPKKERRIKTKKIQKQIRMPNPIDEVVEADKRLYYLNKKMELREKYKQEKKESFLLKYGGWAIIGIIIICTMYMSYKHIKETLIQTQEMQRDFMLDLTKKIAENPNLINPTYKEPEKEPKTPPDG